MAKRSRRDKDNPREKGETAMTQNPKPATTAKVLPFRIIAFRVPARKFEEIEEHLKLPRGSSVRTRRSIGKTAKQLADNCTMRCARSPKSENRAISKCKNRACLN
jgi:hypothetical protein